MLDRASIDRRLSEIDDAIHAILARLDALEGHVLPDGLPAARADAPVLSATAIRAAPGGLLGLTGRTFIVLGGAFLLRALTESGVLPSTAGAWLGIAYASAWLVAADRAKGSSALFHGLAALIVALPLIVESAARFGFFSPMDANAALAGIGLLALVVASRGRMAGLAMLALGGALLASIVIAVATGHFAPSAAVIIALGIASLWIGYDAGWSWLAWPAAAIADLAVLASSVRATADPPRDPPATTLALHALVVIAYLGSFALRNLFHERSIRTFEVAQTGAVLLIGFTGALAVAEHHGFAVAFIAVPSAVAGLVTFVQVFARVLPRRGRGGISVQYYLSLAFALSVTGLTLMIEGPWRSTVLAGAAVAATFTAWKLALPIVALHGALAAALAMAHSGLLALATTVWLRPAAAWPPFTLPAAVLFAALCVCYALPRPPTRKPADEVMVAIARTAIGGLMVWSAGALLVKALATQFVSGSNWLATMKTVTLAAAAVVLARARRWPRVIELGWLTYPVLAVALMKIFVEDLSVSAPKMLVVAFVVYGAALTIASRIWPQAPGPDPR